MKKTKNEKLNKDKKVPIKKQKADKSESIKKPKEKIEKVKKSKTLTSTVKTNNKDRKEKKKIDWKLLKAKFDKLLLKKRFQYLIAVIVAIIIIIEIIYCGVCISIKLKYAKYTEKMDILGFSVLYDNGKATAYESITKGEAIKLIIASIYNVNDITDFAYEPEFDDKNAIWATYAYKEEIITQNDITKANINSKISYIDVLEYYTKAREILMNNYSDITGVVLNFKNAVILRQDAKYYLADAIASNLIENSTDRFNPDEKMIKGEMSRLVVNFVTNFNTITTENVKVNNESSAYPKNANDYPYIAEGIDKSIYEIPFYIESETGSYTPTELYKYRKEFFEQAVERLNYYYDKILNIDYKTINLEEFKKSINDILQYHDTDAEYEEYIKYVKDNKLVIKGKVAPLIPIVYVDGSHYRVRCKVEIEIVEGNTQKSVIYGDLSIKDGVTYTNKKSIFYADIPMETSLTSYAMYPITSPFIKNISGKVNNALLNVI